MHIPLHVVVSFATDSIEADKSAVTAEVGATQREERVVLSGRNESPSIEGALVSLERESLDQEMSADNVAESAPDAATGDAEETFEEFTLDDIEVIESKVFG
jgi:hypothetical protein